MVEKVAKFEFTDSPPLPPLKIGFNEMDATANFVWRTEDGEKLFIMYVGWLPQEDGTAVLKFTQPSSMNLDELPVTLKARFIGETEAF